MFKVDIDDVWFGDSRGIEIQDWCLLNSWPFWDGHGFAANISRPF